MLNLPPTEPAPITKKVKIHCLNCSKDFEIQLAKFQLQKSVTCPDCGKKEAIITSM